VSATVLSSTTHNNNVKLVVLENWQMKRFYGNDSKRKQKTPDRG
jgi:hypothetical protein